MTDAALQPPLRRLLVRNTVYNLIGQAAPALVAIAALPVLTRTLGAERFGVLAIVWLLLTYLFDFGCGRATTKFVAELLAAGQRQRLAAVTTTAALLQLGLGLVLGCALAVAAPWLVSGVLGITGPLRGEAVTSFLVLSAAVPFVLLAAAYRGVLEAAQRFDLVNAIRVPTSAATYLLPVAAVLLGWNLVGIVALLATSRVIVTAVYALVARRIVPESARLAWSRAEVLAIAVFGGWLTVSTIVSPILVYSERLALGAFISAAAVGVYAAAAEPIMRLLIVPASLIGTLFPAFSSLFGAGERARIVALGYRSIKYLILPLALAVALAIPFADPLLGWWLGAPFLAGAPAFQVLGIGVVATAIGYVPSTALQAAGRSDITAKLHLAELPLFALMLVLFIPSLGILGAALAWAGRGALDATLLCAAAARLGLVDRAAARYERLPQTLLVVALLLGSALAAAGIPDLATRLAVVGVAIGLAGFAAWRFALHAADRALLLRTTGPSRVPTTAVR